jgi:RND family efflux transporter MFP subunit
VTKRKLRRYPMGSLILLAAAAVGCQRKDPAPAAGGGPAMQGLPVQTISVTLAPVADSSEYVATIKSRRSATLMPQVSGTLTAIHVHSGEHVSAGAELMEIDPRQQQATVESQRATERQKKAVYDYNIVEVERQRKLFEAGVTSRDAYDQAQQAFDNAKADYEAAIESRKTQEQLLDYYTVRAPFDGIVGDVPVHVGDYVSQLSSPATILTTLDENKDLEAYIYVPTERSADVRMGLSVELVDNSGKLVEKTKIDFISPEVESGLQGILVKAPVHSGPDLLRNAELVRARIVWNTSPKAVVPVLAVSRQGGQTFVYLAENKGGKYFAQQRPITVGDTVGNDYAVEHGLEEGDRVIVSGTQFLVDGAPVIPLPSGPPPSAPGTGT